MPPPHIGSSPRMRGTPVRRLTCRPVRRIIPAHAGNSGSGGDPAWQFPDHPRACGELLSSSNRRLRPTGSSPRMRELNRAAVINCTVDGSSPRMRGTRTLSGPRNRSTRIIPAHAGNSHPRPDSQTRRADHPRACGELARPQSRPIALPLDHPRACGELNLIVSPAGVAPGSSPRMRGTHTRAQLDDGHRRIIPGACGELELKGDPLADDPGSSPRMRGTLTRHLVSEPGQRIIPAHAGTRGWGGPGARDHRIIPAHAGNSLWMWARSVV